LSCFHCPVAQFSAFTRPGSVLAVEQLFLLKLDFAAAAAAHLRAEDVMSDVKDGITAMLNQCGWLVRRQEPTTTMISCSVQVLVVAMHSK
jgi:hypothetical protein